MFVLVLVRVHDATARAGRLDVSSLPPECIRTRSLAPSYLHIGVSVSQL